MHDIILKAINEVLDGKCAVLISEVDDATELRRDIGLDSFDLAELTVRIEEMTGIDIFENGIVKTIGEIKDVLGS